MIQLEQQHREFWVGLVGLVGGVVDHIPTTCIQLAGAGSKIVFF